MHKQHISIYKDSYQVGWKAKSVVLGCDRELISEEPLSLKDNFCIRLSAFIWKQGFIRRGIVLLDKCPYLRYKCVPILAFGKTI